jgi:hypothetical protein
LLKGKLGGKAQNDGVISKYISEKINWKDAKSKPSGFVVGQWRSIAAVIKKQPELSAVTQRVDSNTDAHTSSMKSRSS